MTTSQNLKVDVSYAPVILLLDRFLKDLSNFILLMLLGFCAYVYFVLNMLSLKHSSVSTFVSSYISFCDRFRLTSIVMSSRGHLADNHKASFSIAELDSTLLAYHIFLTHPSSVDSLDWSHKVAVVHIAAVRLCVKVSTHVHIS